MEAIEITSLDDERVAAFARLTEAQLRNKLEPQLGVFIAESPKVITRAIDAGLQPLSFLAERKHLPACFELVQRAGVVAPVFTGATEVLAGLTGFQLTRGVLAAFRRPAMPQPEDLITQVAAAKAKRLGVPEESVPLRVAVLEAIVDHTNVGAAFRSAAALGVDAVLVTPTCCDPLYRRAVRVSMGTVFQVPWCRIGATPADWPGAGMQRLHALGFATAAMALSDDSVTLRDAALNTEPRLAIIMGTEGDGLAPATIAQARYTVRIPMAHGVDSLNVAAASAVAFYQLCS